jgi:very-short-patch-repair endonuclease
MIGRGTLEGRSYRRLTQFEVWHEGRFVARLELAWPERVGLEYDGAQHREFHRQSRDLARHNGVRSAGWRVYQVDAPALNRLDHLIRSLATLLDTRRPP